MEFNVLELQYQVITNAYRSKYPVRSLLFSGMFLIINYMQNEANLLFSGFQKIKSIRDPILFYKLILIIL